MWHTCVMFGGPTEMCQSVKFTVYSLQDTMNGTDCTMYIVQCTVYSV